MATTSIDVIALVALAGVGQVTLTIGTNIQSCLPYLGLDAIEIWAAATNDRAGATKIGETTGFQYVHSGLAASTTRYYWARARNKAATLGAYYPVSATAGVSATTLSTAPGPNSVGTGELQNGAVTNAKIGNAEITDAKIVSLSATKMTAGTITASISIQSPTITGGLLQTSSGSTRIQMNASGNDFTVYSGGSQKVYIGTSGVTPTISATGYSLVAIEAIGVGGSNGHALRGHVSGGGSGLVGVTSTGGGYALYAETGPIGPFTGSHDAFFAKGDAIDIGDIVYDDRVLARNGIDDTVTLVQRAAVKGQRGVVGVVSHRIAFEADSHISALPSGPNDSEPTFVQAYLASLYDRLTINGVGEGQLNVCGRGGDIAVGDFIIASDLAGKGERLDMSLPVTFDVLSTIVARAREAVTFDDPDQVTRVACIYLCG